MELVAMGEQMQHKKLLVALIVILVTLGGMVSAHRVLEYQRTGEREQERLRTQVTVIQKNLIQNLASVNNVLAQLKTEIGKTGKLDQGLNERLKILAEAMPVIRTLLVTDARGMGVAASRTDVIIGHDLSKRDYFQVPLLQPDPEILYFSPPFKTIGTNIHTIAVTRMITGPDGTFAGVVTAVLEPDYLKTLISSVVYAPDMRTSLVDHDGEIFMLTPDTLGITGMKLNKPGSFFSRHRASGQPISSFSGKTYATGQNTLIVLSTVQHPSLKCDRPIIATTSRYTADVYEAFYRDTLFSVVLYLLITLSSLVAYYRFQKRRDEYELQKSDAATALAESESRLRAIINNEPECIKILDAQGRLLEMNPAGLAMIEADSLEQVAGQSVFDLIAPEYREGYTELHRRVIAGETMQMEYEIVGLKGGRVWLETHAVPMFEQDTIVHLAVTRDIADKKQAEQKMLQSNSMLLEAKKLAESANRAKSDFLANMSHEIRTPMNAITGMAYLMQQTPLDKRQLEYLSCIRGAADTLLRIINDILDFSKIEAGKMELESVTFELQALIKAVQTIATARAKEKELEISFSIAAGLPALLVGDPLRLQQVLTNLVVNAVKFTAQGSVQITVAPADRISRPGNMCLTFAVIDTGIGMDNEHLQHIFAPFTQADSSISRRYGGTGLGLSIVTRLLELMGSRLEVISAPGQGSSFTFTVELGVALDQSQMPSSVHHAEGSLPQVRGAKVLVVEDNKINQIVAQEILQGFGAEVITADNGRAGVDLALAQSDLDMVFMDIQMPGMNGYEATTAIRQVKGMHELPIIAMTAHAFSEERERCQAAGMNDHIAKPIDPDQLYAVMHKWMSAQSSS